MYILLRQIIRIGPPFPNLFNSSIELNKWPEPIIKLISEATFTSSYWIGTVGSHPKSPC